MADKERLVVIGNGMAGARAVEEILERGGKDLFQITMIGDEPYGNYNRILLSNVLNGSQDETEIFLNPLAWYQENGITLLAGTQVIDVWTRSRHVVLEDGRGKQYDRLIIATGSVPFLPPIDGLRTPNGDLRPGVFVFRSLDDCRKIARFAEGKRRAAVIGGGLLGLEAARGLQRFGAEVHVVHLGSSLMDQQLDLQGGQILQQTLASFGVHAHLNKNTRRVLGQREISGLEFTDDTTLECDLVVVAAGIRANSELARRAGLKVERGIVVNNQLRTSDPRIYAVGECAQHRGRVYGLVAPLWEQAKVLADHITDKNPQAAYHGSKVATKLKVMGVEVACMGSVEAADEDDEVIQFTDAKRGTYKKLVIRNGRLAGATLLGDISKANYLMQAFDKNTPLPEERLGLLFDIGAPSAVTSVAEMPNEMQVCNCNGVSKGDIAACVKNGKFTLAAVMSATRAGMGCGSCKGQVLEVVTWASGGELAEDPAAHYYVPGVPLAKPELAAAVKQLGLRSVSAVFEALADGKEDAGSKPGLASLLNTIWADEYVDERDARFINDRVHANIQKDGTFSVIPQIPGGITSPEQLRRIAEVAEKYQVPMVKLTGGQRIDLLGVKKEDLPNVWRDLDMPSGFAYAKRYRTCKSCVGSDFCRYGLGNSVALSVAVERRFQGLDAPAKLKLAAAGCPRNCSEVLAKDIGFVAVDGGKWEVYIGGAAGAHVRKGDLLASVDTEADALRLAGRFIQYYREHAKYLERTYAFVPRVGIERLRAIVVEDT